ncbi:MAG: YitT family protein [Bacteroidales bacterium]|nr:YitT family protein [Bacteroidales bacterium]
MSRGNSFWSLFYDYFVITLGVCLYCGAWAFFLMPNNLIGGGVSGLSAIVYYATGISMGITNFSVNALLLVVAFFILGRGFGLKTIYAIIMSSLALQFFPSIIPTDFVNDFTAENGKMLCVVMGGALTGLGIGLTFTHGGSTGGTDIIAMIINKYKDITPGRLLLMLDFVIILSSLLIPSYLPDGSQLNFTGKIANVIYALVLVAVNSYTVDLYLTGSKQSVQIMIFSKKYEALADEIAFNIKRGVTLLRSRGWFNKQESEVLLVVARKTDLSMILARIKEVDPAAFISVSSVMGVYGLGFDTIKNKSKKTSK